MRGGIGVDIPAAVGVVTAGVVTVSIFEDDKTTARAQQTASNVAEDLRVVPVQVAVVVGKTDARKESAVLGTLESNSTASVLLPLVQRERRSNHLATDLIRAKMRTEYCQLCLFVGGKAGITSLQ